MEKAAYDQLCEAMSKRGGGYPGMDIPEFYPLARELFTPEEAAVCSAMPKGFSPAGAIAREMDRDEDEILPLLEAMADKGLCMAVRKDGISLYGTLPFVPGIFEYQLMRGTSTDRDKRLAKLIHAYKAAVDSLRGPVEESFPTKRVITVDRMIKAGNTVHTYDQVASYIKGYEPLAVSTCFCRHEAKLIDESEHCGKPDEVCMQFGHGAQFVIDRGMGRKISKDEAKDILNLAEEAGLVHASLNRQELDFLCNCCSCHCMILKSALSQPKPGVALFSGFQPSWNEDLCTACETCIERCPSAALTMGNGEAPEMDPDRCFGCGVCATGCPSGAIEMVSKPDAMVPPLNQKELIAAVKAARA